MEKIANAGVISEARHRALLDYPWHHDVVIHEAGVPPIHTPAVELAKLPDAVKERLHIVHTTQGALPPDSGLRIAPVGLRETIRIPVGGGVHRRTVEWVRAMRAVEPFADMSSEKVEEFLELVQPRTFQPGEYVIRRGDKGDAFYMILAGKCAIENGEVKRKVFGLYDYFGEASLVLNKRRTADVVAISVLELLVMDGEAFMSFVGGSEVLASLRRLYSNRDDGTWELMDANSVLATLNTTQRTRLQSVMVRHPFVSGEVMARSSELGCGWLVASGTLLELRQPRTHERGVGQVAVDVRAVFDGVGSRFDVVAQSDGVAYRLPHADFRSFLLDYPGLYLRLLHRDS